MPDDLESIGGLSTVISGDYSQLMADLQTAQNLAADAGTEIAAGLEAGASGATSLTTAAEELAGTIQDTGDAAHYGAQSAEELGKNVQDAGEKAHESEGAFSELSEKIIDLATEMGVVVGVGELIKETFSAFSTFESASVALTALTGSAETAHEQIEMLEQLAQNENLSFPALLEANQRMIAFGFSAEDVPSALQAAADAAGALNTDISSTSNAIDRLAVSGMAGARQLVQLGLTTADLASAMGVTEDEAKKAFAALDQETRLEVVTAALGKFAGQAQVAADTLKGQWQGVKNTFEGFFVTLGNFLEPAAKQILEWFNTVGKAAETFVLALQINFEKLEFYFEKFTGQVDAANAKAQEINANAEKFRALVEGATGIGGGAGGATGKGPLDPDALQAKVAAELADKEAITQLSAAQRDLLNATQDQINLGDILKDQLKDLQSEHDKYAQAAATAGGANAYFAQTMSEAIASFAAVGTEAPPVVDAFVNTGKAAKETLGILAQTETLKPPFDALAAAIGNVNRALDTGDLAHVQQMINRLAVDDLPTAVSEQERYVQKLEDAGSSTQKLAAAQKELLTLQMQLAQVQDQSTTSYAAKLALIELETKNLGFSSKNVFGTVIGDGLNALDKEFSGLGTQIAKTAIETQKWGQLGHQVLTQLAEDILSTLLNALVKMGEQFLIEQLTQRATTSATNVSAVTSEAAVAAANAFASTAAIPIIGPALAPAAAAEAEGFVMGLVPQAAFEMGGYVPETMLALVHKGEYVVPAKDVQAAGGGQGSLAPGGISISIGQLHGVTRDTADHLAELIFRKARLAGAFR